VGTRDGTVLVFIGGEYNPSAYDGPLPSHLILLGGIVVIISDSATPANRKQSTRENTDATRNDHRPVVKDPSRD